MDERLHRSDYVLVVKIVDVKLDEVFLWQVQFRFVGRLDLLAVKKLPNDQNQTSTEDQIQTPPQNHLNDTLLYGSRWHPSRSVWWCLGRNGSNIEYWNSNINSKRKNVKKKPWWNIEQETTRWRLFQKVFFQDKLSQPFTCPDCKRTISSKTNLSKHRTTRICKKYNANSC